MKRTPPEKPPPKWNNFGGGSPGGVLFLRFLIREETLPGGGVLSIKL